MQRTNRRTDRCVYRNRIRHYPNFGIEGLAIATVVAGIILVIMGALKLGTVIKFIPYPIVVGFTSGIAITIFTTQMKDLFGLTMDKVPADFISKWIAYFEHSIR